MPNSVKKGSKFNFYLLKKSLGGILTLRAEFIGTVTIIALCSCLVRTFGAYQALRICKDLANTQKIAFFSIFRALCLANEPRIGDPSSNPMKFKFSEFFLICFFYQHCFFTYLKQTILSYLC